MPGIRNSTKSLEDAVVESLKKVEQKDKALTTEKKNNCRWLIQNIQYTIDKNS